jgi:hypothetical protein
MNNLWRFAGLPSLGRFSQYRRHQIKDIQKSRFSHGHNFGPFCGKTNARFASLIKLSIDCVNCVSTSSAIVMTSGSNKLKSSELRLACKVPKIVTRSIRDSCTSISGVLPGAYDSLPWAMATTEK